MSILKPEGSLTIGLATAAMVYASYTYALPSGAMMHATQPQDVNIEAARKKAAWTSVFLVSVVSLLAKDKTIFVIGGLAVIALDAHARVANSSSPDTGKVVSNTGYTSAKQAVPVADQGNEAYA